MIEQLKRLEVQTFIKDHENDDPTALVLASAKYPDLPVKLIAGQIKARKKAKTKLPQFYQTEGIIYPQGISLEQSSSESTALYKANLVIGDTLTDLTGGFGIDVYYFSKVLDQVNYVEVNSELTAIVQHNCELLNVKNVSVHNQQAESFIEQQKPTSDWYYLDPARRNEANQKVFRIEDCTPDLNLIIPKLSALGSKLLIKLSPMLDVDQALAQLGSVKEVHVVSVNNECKELLFCIDPDFNGSTRIKTANIRASNHELFDFDLDSEPHAIPMYGSPNKFLYEPNASIMKSGGVNSIATIYDLHKLHRNSHLYTSETLVADFPGRTFHIKRVTTLNKKKLKSILPGWKANISTRNYPESVADIRKKLKIKEGGDIYLFATTLLDGTPSVLVCERV